MAVSRVFKCNVIGVEFGRAAVVEAGANAQEAPKGTNSQYVQGDAERPPLRHGIFDGVFCECSMSLFLDKAGAVSEAASLLRPGGRFGLSDVTLEPGSLPEELDGTLGQLLCLTDALTVDGYRSLLTGGGLVLVDQVDASVEGLRILDTLEAKLGAYLAWQEMTGQQGPDAELLGRAPGLLNRLRDMIQRGQLGYWVFVAEKPQS